MVDCPQACLCLAIGGIRNGSSRHGLDARSWAVDLDVSECLHIVLRYGCSNSVASELFPQCSATFNMLPGCVHVLVGAVQGLDVHQPVFAASDAQSMS